MLYLFIIPILAALGIIFAPLSPRNLKIVAFFSSLIPLIFLVSGVEITPIRAPWIMSLGLEFHLNLDSLASLFVYLSAIIIPISILSTPRDELSGLKSFYALLLLTEGLLIGFFTSQNLLLFVLFFEALLIPLFLILTLWGSVKKTEAALKFIIYMISGSIFMIVATLALFPFGFDFETLSSVAKTHPYAPWIAAVFLLAFAVKTPLFPFHAWLPDTYTQAPLAGTILLSALLSKAGIFGFLRIGQGLFPEWMTAFSPYLIPLAIVGVFYGALAAYSQNEFKRLIAYSSLSHVNFILVGVFVFNAAAYYGTILQAFNHGITITALFLVVYWLEKRIGDRGIGNVQGLTKYMPRLGWLTLFFILSSVALPGTNNFVGELLILFGLFAKNPWATGILTLSVIFSAVYMLRMMQKVYFGEPSLKQKDWVDLRLKEALIALPLAFLIMWIGIYPAPFLEKISPKAIQKEQT